MARLRQRFMINDHHFSEVPNHTTQTEESMDDEGFDDFGNSVDSSNGKTIHYNENRSDTYL